MADPVEPDTGPEPSTTTDGGSPPGMPRWVKVSGLVVGILILLAVAVMMFGGGQHGPGRHAPGGEGGNTHEGDVAAIDGAPELAVTAADLQFDPARVELPAGMPLNVALTSTDLLHDLVVEEIDFHLDADRGETAIGATGMTRNGWRKQQEQLRRVQTARRPATVAG